VTAQSFLVQAKVSGDLVSTGIIHAGSEDKAAAERQGSGQCARRHSG